jgi:type IV secretion system protein VirB6
VWNHLLAQAMPADASSTHVASYMLGTLLATLTKYIENTSQTVIAVVTIAANALLTGYIVLWGAGIATGHIQEAFGDGARRIIRIGLIINFALVANLYQQDVSNYILQVPIDASNRILSGNSLASAVDTTTCAISNAFDPEAVDPESLKDIKLGYFANILDCAMGQGIKMGNAIWNFSAKNGGASGLSDLGSNGLQVMIYGSTAGIVAMATGIIMVTFIVLALLLGLGPIFILLATFDYTRRYFEGWVGQLVTNMILFVLISSIISIIFQYFYVEYIFKLPLNDNKHLIINSVKVLGASIATFFVLQQAHSIASALGHGIALHAQGGMNRIFEAGRGGGYRGAGAMGNLARAAAAGTQEVGISAAQSLESSTQRDLQRARMTFNSGAANGYR